MTPEIGVIYDNRYKLIKQLGKGGFASTFLAEDLKTESKVVIKLPDVMQLGDPAVYERFRREISIGKILDNPDIPKALTFSEGNPPYIVMEYAEGESLADIMRRKKYFSVDEAVKLTVNLLKTLYYCHQKGIYHRDIKPENLMLGLDDHLKIIDFGISNIKGSPRVTYRGFSSLTGTPEYMAPEQIKGERGGPETDIYAVGCLIYNLLAGVPPFTNDNPLTVMYQHMTADIRPLTEIRKDVSPYLWGAIRKSLFRRKEARYSSALDMAKHLEFPEKSDIELVNKPDPPLTAVVYSKKRTWIIAFIFAILILGIIILAAFMK